VPVSWSTDCKRTVTESSTEPALVVFAWGNESRGDDGIGPLLARRLEALALTGLRVIEDHQLNIEHVTDFADAAPLLFIDASLAIDSGFRLERIVASTDGNFSTHAISPQALLNVFQQSTGREPPEAFLLHIAGKYFELGESLSETSSAAAEDAWEFLRNMLEQPTSEWRSVMSVEVA